MTPLLLLAEKVEGLDGPDREVDVRISLGLSGVGHSEEDVADLLRVRDEPTGYGKYRPADEYVPRYTASLDAAIMSLVPEGCDYDVGRYNEALCCARVWRRGFMRDAETWCAATPSLALCAAALRARAAMEAGDAGDD